MNNLLKTVEFWAAHYYLLASSDDEEFGEPIPEIFGINAKAVQDFYLSVLVKRQDAIAPIWVQLSNGFMVGSATVDCGEDGHQMRFLINRQGWDDAVLVGYDSGHFALPAFRWEELEAITQGETESLTGAIAALLLFPSVELNDAADLMPVRTRLSNWWERLNLVQPGMIARLVSNSMRRRTGGAKWNFDSNLGWINSDEYSLRNPNTNMIKFSSDRFSRIKEFTDKLGVAA